MPIMQLTMILLATLALGALLGWSVARLRVRAELREQSARLKHALNEARTDSLTGLWNRKAFDEFLSLQTAIARRYGLPCSMLLVDVDHFKAINDTHGHLAGDAALCAVAGLLKTGSRESDYVARYGGDEFAILLPQTDSGGALVLAERIRSRLENMPVSANGQQLRVRISGGIATLQAEEGAAAFVDRADRALYVSKQAGRNRIHS